MTPQLTWIYRNALSPLIRTGAAISKPWLHKVKERLDQYDGMLLRVPEKRFGVRRILVHASSMGELEQCVPVITQLRANSSDLEFVVSCSSPSGFSHATKLHPLVTCAVYHPSESASEAREFLDTIQPDAVLWDRYDVWPMFANEVHKRQIPCFLINATFPSAATVPLLGQQIRRTYQGIEHIIASTEADARKLSVWLSKPVPWKPDTRMDRVAMRVQQRSTAFDHLRSDPQTLTIVIGSSWDADVTIWGKALQMVPYDVKPRLVFVPHEPSDAAVQHIQSSIPNSRVYSSNLENSVQPLIINRMGVLLDVYGVADAAYVGGGFGSGVHSLAEPAGYGIPLACGPCIDRSRDASSLTESGACTVVSEPHQLADWIIQVITNQPWRDTGGAAARRYVTTSMGSTTQIADVILRELNGKL